MRNKKYKQVDLNWKNKPKQVDFNLRNKYKQEDKIRNKYKRDYQVCIQEIKGSPRELYTGGIMGNL